MRRPAGGLEAVVVAALAAGTEPMTVADVRRAIGEELAHTTVLTVLNRLVDKGRASRDDNARAHRYSIVSHEGASTALRMRRLLDADLNRAAVLTRFVDKLSPDEEDLLRTLLRDGSSADP